MSQTSDAPVGAYCDPATGLCTPAALAPAPKLPAPDSTLELIYVGDPMCSWCWGISPELHRLEQAAAANDIPYRIVVGGLRPDDGEVWNEQFRGFLRHHWEEVNERSGQPFGYELFDLAHFQYNTEPSCRAVVAARTMDAAVASRFFELTQHHFYVQNRDPKEVAFYRPICLALGLDFERFARLFDSEEIRRETQRDFQLNRSWGVRGYPTVVLAKAGKLYGLATGYSTFEEMWAGVESIVATGE